MKTNNEKQRTPEVGGGTGRIWHITLGNGTVRPGDVDWDLMNTSRVKVVSEND